MVSNDDLQKWQQAINSITAAQNELAPEELSAVNALVSLINSGNFQASESGSYIQILKTGLHLHAKNRLLQLYLKNFIALCEKYFKTHATTPTGGRGKRQSNTNDKPKKSGGSSMTTIIIIVIVLAAGYYLFKDSDFFSGKERKTEQQDSTQQTPADITKPKDDSTAAADTVGGIAKTAIPLNLNANYKLQLADNSQGYSDFKIVTPTDGNLFLSIETFAESAYVALFNENGLSLEPTKNDAISGNSYYTNLRWAGNINSQGLVLSWNTTVEKFKGSFTWKLDAGVYYLRASRSTKGLSSINLSIYLKELSDNEMNSSTLPGKFPQASERLLSTADLQNLRKEEKKIMRNEIFARHGYIFLTADMKTYFRNQDWYKPQYNNVTSMLTSIEKKNIEFIKRYE